MFSDLKVYIYGYIPPQERKKETPQELSLFVSKFLFSFTNKGLTHGRYVPILTNTSLMPLYICYPTCLYVLYNTKLDEYLCLYPSIPPLIARTPTYNNLATLRIDS